jgi:hypothetical protein
MKPTDFVPDFGNPSGEVLLTASMSEVFLCLGDAVWSWNAALRQHHAKGVVVQIGHASPLSEHQPAEAVKTAGQFNLHVRLAFPPAQRAGSQGLARPVQESLNCELGSHLNILHCKFLPAVAGLSINRTPLLATGAHMIPSARPLHSNGSSHASILALGPVVGQASNVECLDVTPIPNSKFA